jgi:hypothetical protein
MSERSTPSAFGRLPWGLLGAVLLALLVERFVEKNALFFKRPEYWDWKTSTQASRRKVRDCQVLCFGTSISQQGLIPGIIAERTGWRAYNLSVCWGQAAGQYYLLKQALDSGVRPKAVVIESHPQCLSGGLYQAIRFWPELLRTRDVVELAWNARNAEFLGTTLLACWVPSIRDRFSLRSNILDALSGTENVNPTQTLAYIRNKNRNRGSIISGKNPAYQGTVAPAFEHGLAPDDWSCDPINAAYLRRFFRLAQENGITVYWLMNPYSPALQSRREQKGLDARYSRFARGFLDEFSNLVVLDARHSGYGQSVFTDAAHLDRDGACTLSADVGDALRASSRVASRHWVELPACGTRPTDAVVEDLAQSILARANEGSKRR